jgi:UPF0716 protein FxsA
MPLLLGLVLLILIEISLYVLVGGVIGLWATLGLVLASGVAGVWVLRFQGRHMVERLMDAAVERRNPLGPAADGMLKAMAGVLLILPGFLTDLAGLVLLVPAVRHKIIASLAQRARMATVDRAVDAMMHGRHGGGRPRPDMAEMGEVIEGQAEEVPQESGRHGKKPSGWVQD